MGLSHCVVPTLMTQCPKDRKRNYLDHILCVKQQGCLWSRGVNESVKLVLDCENQRTERQRHSAKISSVYNVEHQIMHAEQN